MWAHTKHNACSFLFHLSFFHPIHAKLVVAVKGYPHSMEGVNIWVSQHHSTSLNPSHIQKKKFNPPWRHTSPSNLASQHSKISNATAILVVVGFEIVCKLT